MGDTVYCGVGLGYHCCFKTHIRMRETKDSQVHVQAYYQLKNIREAEAYEVKQEDHYEHPKD